MNSSWHDSDFAFPRRDNSGTVWPNQPRTPRLQELPSADHIERWNPLCDTDNQFDLRVSGFHDGVGRKRRRHKNHRSIGASLVHCFLHTVKDGPAFVRGPSFAGRHAADNLRSIFCASFGMKCAFTPGDALHDDPRRFVYENAHAALAAATTFSAASFIVSATMKFSPDSFNISLPCSTFVPSSRNTTGR